MIKIIKKNIYGALFLLVSGLLLNNAIVYGAYEGNGFDLDGFMPDPCWPDGEIVGLSEEIGSHLKPYEQVDYEQQVLQLAPPTQSREVTQEDQENQDEQDIKAIRMKRSHDALAADSGEQRPSWQQSKKSRIREDQQEKEVAESVARGANHRCPDCGKTFSHRWMFNRHIKTHKEKPFACLAPGCGRSFSHQPNLTAHMRTHSGEKPYKCGICDRGFAQKGSCNRHIRTHTQEKRYSCQECGKGFAEHRYLIDHMRIHTGEKPYKCGICGRGFTQQSSCKRHMKTHQDESSADWISDAFAGPAAEDQI